MTEIIVAIIIVGIVGGFTAYLTSMLSLVIPSSILIFVTLAIGIRTALFIIHRK